MSDVLTFNVGNIEGNMKLLGETTAKDLARAMYEEALLIQNAAMDGAPYRHGPLHGSFITIPPEYMDGEGWVTRVMAGGPSAPYAVAIHEHLSEHSPRSWQIAEERGGGVHFATGGPKFLENAVNAAIEGFGERLLSRMASNMVSG